MQPALIELDGADQHLLVLGDQLSGKTTILRTLIRELTARSTPDELVLAVMDLRGDAAREVPEAYLGGHATSSSQARQLAVSIAEELTRRLDPSHLPGRTSAAAGSDPRVVVIVDDFDILASGGTEPLAHCWRSCPPPGTAPARHPHPSRRRFWSSHL